MIESILDTDLYKLTMQHAVLQKFPRAVVRYNFINRGNTKFPKGFDVRLKEEIKDFAASIQLEWNEKEFLSQRCYFLPPSYLDFLNGYRYNPAEVIVEQLGGSLRVEISGYWYRTIMWEVPLLAMISELYYEMNEYNIPSRKLRRQNNKNKSLFFVEHDVSFSEFGTRRRFSYDNQDEVVDDLKCTCGNNLLGTSNVHLAHRHNLKAMGTQAHEWYIFHGAKYGPRIATKLSLQNWVDVYNGDLGIALTDTFTSKVFFDSFDTKFSKLFDGVRQDSGHPNSFIRLAVAHYNRYHIYPSTKTILFSDALNCKVISDIKDWIRWFGDKIQDKYGIGTFLTNDLEGIKPLNMVIKLTGIYENGIWIPAVKLSDDVGKNTGDKKTIQRYEEELNITKESNEEI